MMYASTGCSPPELGLQRLKYLCKKQIAHAGAVAKDPIRNGLSASD